MKAPLSSLLIGVLAVLLAQATSAQRTTCATGGPALSVSSSYHRGGYASSRVWIPGSYETVWQRVFVPGPSRRVWVEPVYQWRVGLCGARYVCVQAGYWKTVQLPGRHENQRVRVYRPGHWVARGSGH